MGIFRKKHVQEPEIKETPEEKIMSKLAVAETVVGLAASVVALVTKITGKDD